MSFVESECEDNSSFSFDSNSMDSSKGECGLSILSRKKENIFANHPRRPIQSVGVNPAEEDHDPRSSRTLWNQLFNRKGYIADIQKGGKGGQEEIQEQGEANIKVENTVIKLKLNEISKKPTICGVADPIEERALGSGSKAGRCQGRRIATGTSDDEESRIQFAGLGVRTIKNGKLEFEIMYKT